MNGVAMYAAAEVDGLASFLDNIRGGLSAFSTDSLTQVLLVGLGIAVPLVLAWFGFRWISRRATKGLTKGKM